MFTKKLEQMFEERSNNMNEYIKETQERLNKIEEQLNPPAFERGDMVNFLLVGNEFEGEIVEPNYKYENNDRGFFSFTSKTDIIESWRIKYLDKNEVVQFVNVKEEDIWVEDSCPFNDIFNRLDELETRINSLTKVKAK